VKGVAVWQALPGQAAFVASREAYPLLVAPVGAGRSTALRWLLLRTAMVSRGFDGALVSTRRGDAVGHEAAVVRDAANLEATYHVAHRVLSWRGGGRVWLKTVEGPRDLEIFHACRWHLIGVDGVDWLTAAEFDGLVDRARPREGATHPRVVATLATGLEVPPWVRDRWMAPARDGYAVYARTGR
jgi:hypothetical protein